eukprot:1552139-Pyramimonas_sp.AAC.1
MNSPLSLEESMREGVPFYAWCGNEAADELADKGAQQHQIPPARLSCYKWAVAVSALVRGRIVRATLNALEHENREPSANIVRRIEKCFRPDAIRAAQLKSSHTLCNMQA